MHCPDRQLAQTILGIRDASDVGREFLRRENPGDSKHAVRLPFVLRSRVVLAFNFCTRSFASRHATTIVSQLMNQPRDQ